jgi:AraC-like DNA-binding protein
VAAIIPAAGDFADLSDTGKPRMEIRRATPHPALRGVVRLFSERRASLGTASLSWPLSARPHQIIDLYLAEPFRLQIDDGPMATAPETVVVGPQSLLRTRLHLSGEIHVFNILFQPTGFSRLAGIDMASLANEGIMASDILGGNALSLRDSVLSAADFPSRVAAAERWVGAMLDGRAPADGVDHASRLLVAARGRVRIDALVARSGLGARQFQRRFTARVGLQPKLYARTVRFDAALTARRNAPGRPWTAIAHEAGYFDQAHFVRECRALVGAPPSHLIDDWENVLSPLDG